MSLLTRSRDDMSNETMEARGRKGRQHSAPTGGDSWGRPRRAPARDQRACPDLRGDRLELQTPSAKAEPRHFAPTYGETKQGIAALLETCTFNARSFKAPKRSGRERKKDHARRSAANAVRRRRLSPRRLPRIAATAGDVPRWPVPRHIQRARQLKPGLLPAGARALTAPRQRRTAAT